jgi:two-component system chemotaxis response regulator CheY
MATVLICDDSIPMRKAMLDILESGGHEVIVGEDGLDAVWLYREHRPDCALLDIEMPIMTGIEAVTKIMLIDPAAKIAMVTAVRNESNVLQAMSAGAVDYVGKPYGRERVLGTIDKLLGTAEAEPARLTAKR